MRSFSLRIALRPGVFSRLLSDHSLTRKAYLNALASALEYGARLLVGFAVTPLLLAGLGEYYFGTWQILNRLVGYISPASGRPTQALKWMLANQQGSSDFDAKRRYVGSALAIWLLFFPLLGGLGGIFAWFSPVWLKAPAAYYGPIRLAAGLLVVNLALFSLSELPQSVLEGENLGYKRIGLTVGLVTVGGGLTFLALRLGIGLAGVSAAALVTSVLTGLLFLQVVRSYCPWFGVARPEMGMARRFLSLSWWFLGWNLVMNLLTASDVVLLGVLLSVDRVAAYSLTKYAPETVLNLVAIMVFGSAPGLGGIIGAGDLARAAKIRSELMTLTWLTVTVLGTTVLAWNRSLVGLWVGAGQFAGDLPNLLIVAVVTQFVFIRNDANIIDLTLRPRRKVLVGLLSAAVSLACAAALMRFNGLGIVGLCLGIIGGRLLMGIAYPMMVGRFLGIPLRRQVRGALRAAATTALLFALATGFAHLIEESGWQRHIGWLALPPAVALSAGITLLAALFAGLTSDQRKVILRRARAVIAPATD
jgi:O-antigen/teichoic acid export membrane protein